MFEGNSCDQSQIYEALLLSRNDDRSHLSRASNDCMISILGYLNIESISQLDIAVTNTAARVIWLSSLLVSCHRTVNECKHSDGSIRWVVARGIRLEKLKVRDSQRFTCRINGSTLLGLNVSLLRDVSFRECDIGDDEIITLAHDCPYLSEICLYGCVRVTDASIIALSKGCIRLTAIDIGKCTNITDDGLIDFAYECSGINAEYLHDKEYLWYLQRISFHGCTNITDVGISAVASSCLNLNTIDISACSQITDICVSVIATSCSELSTINLSYSDRS